MTFKEIETLTAKSGEMPPQMPLHEQMLHTALCCLYRDYQSGALDQGTATREKRRLRIAYEQAASRTDEHQRLREERLESIRVSEEFRSQLRKALNDGQELDVLFPLACTCIAVLTGDKTLLGSEVTRKLEAHAQLNMEVPYVG